MVDDVLKFMNPFSCIVSGPSKSDKTSFSISFLQKLDSLYTESECDGGIIWFRKVRSYPNTPHITKAYRSILVVVVVVNQSSSS